VPEALLRIARRFSGGSFGTKEFVPEARLKCLEDRRFSRPCRDESHMIA